MLATLLLLAKPAIQTPPVKCVLVVAPGQQPWPEAADKLDRALKDVQWWYSCQMEAHGYGAKTFPLEIGSNGKVVVHIVKLDQEPDLPPGTDRMAEPASNARTTVIRAAEATVGLRSGRDNIFTVVYDGYYWTDREKLQQLPMGFGAPHAWAHLTGWHLYALDAKLFTNETMTSALPDQNEFFSPLVTKIYKTDGGHTIGSRASCCYGTFIHEMGHSFDLHHPPDDAPRVFGDIMTSDYWGSRGNFVESLKNEWCCLTADQAAALNKNPVFQIRPVYPASTGASRSIGMKGAFSQSEELRSRYCADIEVSGSGFTVQDFGAGKQSQSNRDYIWKNLPSRLEGYRFTRVAGGVAATVSVKVHSKGRIWIATDQVHSAPLSDAGFTMIPLSISYISKDGKRNYPMALYFKEARQGDIVPIPQLGWAGTIVIGPRM